MSAPIPLNADAPCIQVAATTAASAAVNLPSTGNTVRILNEGPNTAYVAISSTAALATVPGANAARTCTPVGAGEDVSFTIPATTQMSISAITATGTATLDVQVGEGV